MWCTHIEGAVRDNADSEAIFDANEELGFLEIPMFPSLNLWARVRLALNVKLEAYKVYMDWDGNPPTDSNFLGFLHHGEGRMVIRSMILNFFEGEVNLSSLACKSSAHKMRQEIDWQKSLNDPNKRIPQLWSVYQNGACIACTMSAGEWADLVPDAGEGRKVF